MGIVSDYNDKIVDFQKRLIKRKIRYAILLHRSAITIPNSKAIYDLLPEVIDWLKNNGYTMTRMPVVRLTNYKMSLGGWKIEWK